jgi:hypothetical protein
VPVAERQHLVEQVDGAAGHGELGQRVHQAEREPDQRHRLVRAVDRLVADPGESPAHPKQAAPHHGEPEQDQRDEAHGRGDDVDGVLPVLHVAALR